MPREPGSPIKFRGTPKGEIRALVSEALSRLVFDLKQLESTGYTEDICDVVKKALIDIRHAAVENSGSIWVGNIADQAGDFYKTYVRWNGQGTREERPALVLRRREIIELQDYNQKMSRDFRLAHRRFVPISPMESSFCDVAFARLADVAAYRPDVFKSLTSALKNRRRRMKKGPQ
jgi:hypothetical protein